MNWYRLLKFAQIWEVESDGTFRQELAKMYELEYKYLAVKRLPFNGMPQRREKILVALEEGLRACIQNVGSVLMEVFEDWLDKHAILDPEKWARNSIHNDMKSMEDNDTTPEDHMKGLLWQINEFDSDAKSLQDLYNGPRSETNYYKLFSQIMNNAAKNPQQYPAICEYILEQASGYKEMMFNDLENEGYLEFGKRYNKRFRNKAQALKFIENFILDPIDALDTMDLSNYESIAEGLYSYSPEQYENFMTEIYRNDLFPRWLARWKPMNIEGTRNNIEEVYGKLKNMGRDIIQDIEIINLALQTTHVTGPMTSHLDDHLENKQEYSEDYSTMTEYLDRMKEGKNVPAWRTQLDRVGVGKEEEVPA